MDELTPRWRAVLWGVTAFAALPFFLPGWLPLTDLPEHAASMSSIAHWNDPAFRIAEHYRMGWSSSQYLLAHILGAGLTKLTGSTELACRLILVALAVAWVQSSRLLLRAFRLDQRLAIMSAVLFWNRALVVGFLPYVASLPILFATVGTFVLWSEDVPRLGRRTFVLALAAVAVFYTHASAFSLLGSIAGTIALSDAWLRRPKEAAIPAKVAFVARDAVLRGVWLVPAALLAGAWLFRGRFGMHGSSIRDSGEIGTMNPLRAIKLIALYAHDIWPSHQDEWIAIGFWLLFLGLIVVAAVRRESDVEPVRPGHLIPFVVGFIVYLATPFRVGTGFLLNVRMAPVLGYFALLGVRPARGRVTSGVLLASAGLSVVQCADNVEHILRLQKDVIGVEALLAELPKGTRLMTLNFSGYDPLAAHFTSWLHVGSYHRVMHGGIAAFSFSELPHWSVQYKPESAPPKQGDITWSVMPCLYRNERDGTYFDYVLVRGALNPFKGDPPGPRWTVRGRTSKYTLYEKDLSREPVPPGPTPDEGPCAPPPEKR